MEKGTRVVFQGRSGTVEGSMPNGMIDIRFDDAKHRIERRHENLLARANPSVRLNPRKMRAARPPRQHLRFRRSPLARSNQAQPVKTFLSLSAVRQELRNKIRLYRQYFQLLTSFYSEFSPEEPFPVFIQEAGKLTGKDKAKKADLFDKLAFCELGTLYITGYLLTLIGASEDQIEELLSRPRVEERDPTGELLSISLFPGLQNLVAEQGQSSTIVFENPIRQKVVDTKIPVAAFNELIGRLAEFGVRGEKAQTRDALSQFASPLALQQQFDKYEQLERIERLAEVAPQILPSWWSAQFPSFPNAQFKRSIALNGQMAPLLPTPAPEIYVSPDLNYAFELTQESLERATRTVRGLTPVPNAKEQQVLNLDEAKYFLRLLFQREAFFEKPDVRASVLENVERLRERKISTQYSDERRAKQKEITAAVEKYYRDEDRQREEDYAKAFRDKNLDLQARLRRTRGAYITRPDPVRVSKDGKAYCGNPIDGVAYYLVVDRSPVFKSDFITWDTIETIALKAGKDVAQSVTYTIELSTLPVEPTSGTSPTLEALAQAKEEAREERAKIVSLENDLGKASFNLAVLLFRQADQQKSLTQRAADIDEILYERRKVDGETYVSVPVSVKSDQRIKLVARCALNLLNSNDESVLRQSFRFLQDFGRIEDEVLVDNQPTTLGAFLYTGRLRNKFNASKFETAFLDTVYAIARNDQKAKSYLLLPYLPPPQQSALLSAIVMDTVEAEKLLLNFSLIVQNRISERVEQLQQSLQQKDLQLLRRQLETEGDVSRLQAFDKKVADGWTPEISETDMLLLQQQARRDVAIYPVQRPEYSVSAELSPQQRKEREEDRLVALNRYYNAAANYTDQVLGRFLVFVPDTMQVKSVDSVIPAIETVLATTYNFKTDPSIALSAWSPEQVSKDYSFPAQLLQLRLVDLGFDLGTDQGGYLGEGTKNAVIAFYQRYLPDRKIRIENPEITPALLSAIDRLAKLDEKMAKVAHAEKRINLLELILPVASWQTPKNNSVDVAQYEDLPRKLVAEYADRLKEIFPLVNSARREFETAFAQLNRATQFAGPASLTTQIKEAEQAIQSIKRQRQKAERTIENLELTIPNLHNKALAEKRTKELSTGPELQEEVAKIIRSYVNEKFPEATRDDYFRILSARSRVEYMDENGKRQSTLVFYGLNPEKPVTLRFPSIEWLEELNKAFTNYKLRMTRGSQKASVYPVSSSETRSRTPMKAQQARDIYNRQGSLPAEMIGRQPRSDTAFKETDIYTHFVRPSSDPRRKGLEFYRQTVELVPGYANLNGFLPYRYRAFFPTKISRLDEAVATYLGSSLEMAQDLIRCGAVATPPLERRMATPYEQSELGLRNLLEEELNVKIPDYETYGLNLLFATGKGYPLVNTNPDSIVLKGLAGYELNEDDEDEELLADYTNDVRKGTRVSILLKDKADSPFFAWQYTNLALTEKSTGYPPCVSADQEEAIKQIRALKDVLYNMLRGYNSLRRLLKKLDEDPSKILDERVDPEPLRRFNYETKQWESLPRSYYASDTRQVLTALAKSFAALRRWNARFNQSTQKPWYPLVNAVFRQLQGTYGTFHNYEVTVSSEAELRKLAKGLKDYNIRPLKGDNKFSLTFQIATPSGVGSVEPLSPEKDPAILATIQLHRVLTENGLTDTAKVVHSVQKGGGLSFASMDKAWSKLNKIKPDIVTDTLEVGIKDSPTFKNFMRNYGRSLERPLAGLEWDPEEGLTTNLLGPILAWLPKTDVSYAGGVQSFVTTSDDLNVPSTPVDDFISFIWSSIDEPTKAAILRKRTELLEDAEGALVGAKAVNRGFSYLLRPNFEQEKAKIKYEQRQVVEAREDNALELLNLVGLLASGGLRMAGPKRPTSQDRWNRQGTYFGDITRPSNPLDLVPQTFNEWFKEYKKKATIPERYKKMSSYDSITRELNKPQSQLSRDWNDYREAQSRYLKDADNLRANQLNYLPYSVFSLQLPEWMESEFEANPFISKDAILDRNLCIYTLLSAIHPKLLNSSNLEIANKGNDFIRELLLLVNLYYDLGGFYYAGPLDPSHPLSEKQESDLSSHALSRAIEFLTGVETEIKGGSTGLAIKSDFNIFVTYNPILFEMTRLYWPGGDTVPPDFGNFLVKNKEVLSRLDGVGRYGELMRMLQMIAITSTSKAEYDNHLLSYVYPFYAEVNKMDQQELLTTILRGPVKKVGQPRPEARFGRKMLRIQGATVQDLRIGVDSFGNEVGHYEPFCRLWPFGSPFIRYEVADTGETQVSQQPDSAVGVVTTLLRDPLAYVKFLKETELQPAVNLVKTISRVGLKERKSPPIVLKSPVQILGKGGHSVDDQPQLRKQLRMALILTRAIGSEGLKDFSPELTDQELREKLMSVEGKKPWQIGSEEERAKASQNQIDARARLESKVLGRIQRDHSDVMTDALLAGNAIAVSRNLFGGNPSSYTSRDAVYLSEYIGKAEKRQLSKPTLRDAIEILAPGADFKLGIGGGALSSLDWRSPNIPRPSNEAIRARYFQLVEDFERASREESGAGVRALPISSGPPPANLQPFIDERRYVREKRELGSKRKGLRRFVGHDPIHPDSVLQRANRQIGLTGQLAVTVEPILQDLTQKAEKIQEEINKLKRAKRKDPSFMSSTKQIEEPIAFMILRSLIVEAEKDPTQATLVQPAKQALASGDFDAINKAIDSLQPIRQNPRFLRRRKP